VLAGEIQQVFTNLINNALEAGGSQFVVSCPDSSLHA
jgi:signal transduction histidine kinase